LKAAAVYDLLQPIMTLGWERRLTRRIGDRLSAREGERILDVGCGTGVLARFLAEQCRGSQVTGIDASPPMIRVATRRRSLSNCAFKVALAEELPFEDSSFDAVVSSLFFHHVDVDLKHKSLLEIRRVLRPGGQLLVADMGPPYTTLGRALSYGAWLFFRQPEILENIRGVLPELMAASGFADVAEIFRAAGYVFLYSAHKEA
jgi:ubiquinone/menaquinone biosynthesis C-methylase UbiE